MQTFQESSFNFFNYKPSTGLKSDQKKILEKWKKKWNINKIIYWKTMLSNFWWSPNPWLSCLLFFFLTSKHPRYWNGRWMFEDCPLIKFPYCQRIRRIRIEIPGNSENISKRTLRYSPEYFRTAMANPLSSSFLRPF
jgi:hypothetical protein